FFSSRRRHTRSKRDWSSDVCSSDLGSAVGVVTAPPGGSTIQFSAGDPLQMNGGIAGLANPGSNPATYPATSVGRLLMISYYIQRSEERRVGKECKSRRWRSLRKKNE